MAWLIKQTIDLQKGGNAADKSQLIRPLAYPGNENAHRWEVEVLNGGSPADLSGYSASAEFDRQDGNRVASVSHGVTDNVAWVVFPADVYNIEGIVKARLSLSKTGEDTPIAAITFRVNHKSNGPVIDPSGVTTLDVAALVSTINAAVASIPPTWTELSGEVDVLKSKSEYFEQTERKAMIPYAGNGSATGGGLIVVQNGNQVTINGTSTATSGQSTTKILLSNHVACWTSPTTPSEHLIYDIDLIEGHTYQLSASIISGQRDANDGSGNFSVRAVQYGGTEVASATIGINDTTATQAFVYDGTKILIRAHVARLMICTELVVDITLRDVSTEKLWNAVDSYLPNGIYAAAGFKVATFHPGYYTTPESGNTSLYSSSGTFVTAKLQATKDDYVEICGDGGTGNQRFYAILDANNSVLYRSVANVSGVQYPNMSQYPTAAFIVVNSCETYANTYLFVGPSVANKLAETNETLEAVSTAITHEFNEFVQKNINATTGKLADSTNTITNNNLIAIENIFKAESNYSNITVYMYDSTETYIGNSGVMDSPVDTQKLNELKTSHPTLKYARVRFGGSAHPITLDDYKDNGVSLMLYNTETSEDLIGHVAFDNISAFGEDGVFAPSGEDPLTFAVKIPFNGDNRNQIFTCIAKYEQESGVTTVPTVTFFTFGSTSNLKRTTEYCLGGNGYFETKQWRVIRYPGNTKDIVAVFTIPVGVTCTIKDFYNEYNDMVMRTPYGIRINSHRKFPTTPDDTMPGLMMAVKSGATAMIEIPKRLSDGTWIFYHDDSLVYDDTYIRQADGTQLPSTYNGTLWKNIDFETANSWDWGISTDAIFTGTKPMTMEQFFTICGKTGIMPMLSIHPWPSASELGEIKAIARKCGVLSRLGIKTGTAHIAEAYAVFGNEIESYTIDVSAGSQTASIINAAISAMDGLTGCTVRRVIELFASTAYYAYFDETEANRYDAFGLIAAAGYGCSLAQQLPPVGSSYQPTEPRSRSVLIKPTDFDYWQSKGVSEYTYEYEWSNGLNW